MSYESSPKQNDRKRSRLILGAALFLCLLLLAGGLFLPGSEASVLISLLLLVVAFLPFLLQLEKSHAKARMVATVAVLCALTILCDLASFLMIPFQMGTAMVILSGVSFGPESGFLVGALARLGVNLFYGQGPWTPWQMLAWGLIGFLAGLLFYTKDPDTAVGGWRALLFPFCGTLFGFALGLIVWQAFDSSASLPGWETYLFGGLGLLFGLLLTRKKIVPSSLSCAVFGFFATLLLYGGIMNLSTAVLSGAFSPFNPPALVAVFVAGLPYDLVHAFSCALFLLLFSKVIVKATTRLLRKYHLTF